MNELFFFIYVILKCSVVLPFRDVVFMYYYYFDMISNFATFISGSIFNNNGLQTFVLSKQILPLNFSRIHSCSLHFLL